MRHMLIAFNWPLVLMAIVGIGFWVLIGVLVDWAVSR